MFQSCRVLTTDGASQLGPKQKAPPEQSGGALYGDTADVILRGLGQFDAISATAGLISIFRARAACAFGMVIVSRP